MERITESVARFIHETALGNIPSAAIDRAKTHILDTIGTLCAGSKESGVKQFHDLTELRMTERKKWWRDAILAIVVGACDFIFFSRWRDGPKPKLCDHRAKSRMPSL